MQAIELNVRVASKTAEALDICAFELVQPDGSALPAFSAGSHIDVRLPTGITRQYSLCNDASETHRYLIGVLRDPASRGGSRAMHEQVNEGDLLRIAAPRNHFALDEEAPHSLLLAGGIGITPLLSMAEKLAAAGRSFDMHYCTRSPERAAFRHRIAAAAFAGQVRFHFDDGLDAQKLDIDRTLAAAPADTHLYVCGPKGFIDWVLARARGAGWAESRLHFEFFGAEVAASATDGAFDVKLASSGRVIRVPADRTVVQALSQAGVEIQVSCEQGVCGTCLTRVLEGEPEHKDLYLTPEEQAANDQFTPCCSRSRSPLLVLDI
ncbi:PDR/VanB family oxidoreductase [Variovorax sp. J31P179]|jgi:vanillate O-demethylase ferredoxin subunit|uniref:PDR/VanB family oxidoreductase n=1 Tax=Variovorax sp. J31P179 TaxID=3053508 RepID=UPI0025760809|nr:PDR/VanB family oxidoreductase [Variovorax sp. J31P179]MDM0079175.1 PDR/VanB family oxidoreductase [Variovorax sp. J31P179]